METTTMAPPSSKNKRRCCDCDTELRLGGDAARPLCSREKKKAATTTTGGAGAHCYAYDDGDRLLTILQRLVVPGACGGRDVDDDGVTAGAEVQASAIIRMARAAAAAREDSDRDASRRRRSLRRFLQRRREVRTQEGPQRWRLQ